MCTILPLVTTPAPVLSQTPTLPMTLTTSLMLIKAVSYANRGRMTTLSAAQGPTEGQVAETLSTRAAHFGSEGPRHQAQHVQRTGTEHSVALSTWCHHVAIEDPSSLRSQEGLTAKRHPQAFLEDGTYQSLDAFRAAGAKKPARVKFQRKVCSRTHK